MVGNVEMKSVSDDGKLEANASNILGSKKIPTLEEIGEDVAKAETSFAKQVFRIFRLIGSNEIPPDKVIDALEELRAGAMDIIDTKAANDNEDISKAA